MNECIHWKIFETLFLWSTSALLPFWLFLCGLLKGCSFPRCPWTLAFHPPLWFALPFSLGKLTHTNSFNCCAYSIRAPIHPMALSPVHPLLVLIYLSHHPSFSWMLRSIRAEILFIGFTATPLAPICAQWVFVKCIKKWETLPVRSCKQFRFHTSQIDFTISSLTQFAFPISATSLLLVLQLKNPTVTLDISFYSLNTSTATALSWFYLFPVPTFTPVPGSPLL